MLWQRRHFAHGLRVISSNLCPKRRKKVPEPLASRISVCLSGPLALSYLLRRIEVVEKARICLIALVIAPGSAELRGVICIFEMRDSQAEACMQSGCLDNFNLDFFLRIRAQVVSI
jgi:hypothetical protein